MLVFLFFLWFCEFKISLCFSDPLNGFFLKNLSAGHLWILLVTSVCLICRFHLSEQSVWYVCLICPFVCLSSLSMWSICLIHLSVICLSDLSVWSVCYLFVWYVCLSHLSVCQAWKECCTQWVAIQYISYCIGRS